MRWIALLFSISLMAGAAGAQEMKMHRKQASGEADKSGWMLAASTGGRFSVRLPLKFNDFTVAEAPEAPAALTHTVAAISSERVAFEATRIAYRRRAASAQEYFARFEKGQGLPAKPVSITPRQVGSRRAVDLVFRGPAAVRYQRVVLLEHDLLMLNVESPAEHAAAAQELAARFFDSLQIDLQ